MRALPHPGERRLLATPVFLLLLALLALLAALLFCGSVAAQPSPEARRAFADGETAYRLGRYGEAITAFETAYRLSHAPKLLFNIAQAYRKKFEVGGELTDLRTAREIYQSYLREDPDPGTDQRAEVERILGEIEVRLARTAPPPAPPPTLAIERSAAPPPPAEPVIARPDPRPTPRARPRQGGSILGTWWFWTITGAVVVGAAAATTVALTRETTPDSELGTIDLR